MFDELMTKVHASDPCKLIKTSNYDTRFYEIEDEIPNSCHKYINIPELNKLTKENFRMMKD